MVSLGMVLPKAIVHTHFISLIFNTQDTGNSMRWSRPWTHPGATSCPGSSCTQSHSCPGSSCTQSHFLSRVFLCTELHLGREQPKSLRSDSSRPFLGYFCPDLGNQPTLAWGTGHSSFLKDPQYQCPPLSFSLSLPVHPVPTWWYALHLPHVLSRVYCIFGFTSPISFCLRSLLCKLNSQPKKFNAKIFMLLYFFLEAMHI